MNTLQIVAFVELVLLTASFIAIGTLVDRLLDARDAAARLRAELLGWTARANEQADMSARLRELRYVDDQKRYARPDAADEQDV